MNFDVTDGLLDKLVPLDKEGLISGRVAFYGLRKCFEQGSFGVIDNKNIFISFPMEDSFLMAIAKTPKDQRTVLDNSSLVYHVDSVVELELVEAVLDVIAEAHDTEPEDWSYCVGFSDSQTPSLVFVFVPKDDGIREPADYVFKLVAQTREIGPKVLLEFDRR